jgi:hypothetical protein
VEAESSKNGMRAMDELTPLANKYGSDKGDKVHGAHCYTSIYNALLSARRNEHLRFLEVGLLHPFDTSEAPTRAPSLEMWRTYFPNASLFGFDIGNFTNVRLPNCQIFQGDASKREDLLRVGKIAGPFDVIIDDASHASPHQQITFAALFPFLKSSGIFFIEDLHWQPAELEMPDVPTTRGLLRDFLSTGGISSPILSEPECAYLVSHIAGIDFYDSKDRLNKDRSDGLAAIRKA